MHTTHKGDLARTIGFASGTLEGHTQKVFVCVFFFLLSVPAVNSSLIFVVFMSFALSLPSCSFPLLSPILRLSYPRCCFAPCLAYFTRSLFFILHPSKCYFSASFLYRVFPSLFPVRTCILWSWLDSLRVSSYVIINRPIQQSLASQMLPRDGDMN